MDPKAAAAVIEALEQAERINVARLKPSDIIVVEFLEDLSSEAVERVHRLLKGIWPRNKVLVFDNGTRLKIVEAGSAVELQDPDGVDDPEEVV